MERKLKLSKINVIVTYNLKFRQFYTMKGLKISQNKDSLEKI